MGLEEKNESTNHGRESEVSGSAFGDYLANKYDGLGVLGFSMYLSWVFLIIIDALGVNKVGDAYAIGIVPFFFVGQLISAGILWVFSRSLSEKPAIMIICIVLCILLPLPGIVMFSSGVFGQMLPVIWVVAGFGGLFLLALWGIFLSGLSHKPAAVYPPLAVLVQSLFMLAVLYLFRIEMVKITMVVLPVISIALFFVWWRSALREERVQFFSNTKPPDGQALLRSATAMVANNFLIGFVLYSASIAEGSATGLVVLLVMICAAIYKTHDATHDQRFEVREIIRILAPTAAVGLLLLPYISIELRIACLGFMMLIAMLDEIVCWSAVSEYMHVYRLRPFANMAFGRLGDTIGCSLGYVCAYLVFGTTLGGNILSPIVLSIVVILFIILQIFFFRDNYSPFTEHSEAERDDEANLFPARKPGYWKERCERFADHHELTPRQRETLIHLAKGYSTKAIEGILFVSGHTVKAHVYNIYRKTGVHTRQELIEAIENFEHSGTGKSRNGIIQFG